MLCQNIFFPYG